MWFFSNLEKSPKFDIHVTIFYTGVMQVAPFLGEI
jgi:hypothetical protein